MKTLKKIITIVILLLSSHLVNAQPVYAAAITTDAILFGKYIRTIDTENSKLDTISMNDAKNIFTINAIAIEKSRFMNRMKVIDYQMTICDHGDTTIIKNNTEKLSKTMIDQLQRIKSGSKIYFEGIKAEFQNGDTRSLTLLSFIVI
jgi:hypothetical protein